MFLSSAFLDVRSSPPRIKVTAYFSRDYRGAGLSCRHGADATPAAVTVVYDMSWAWGPDLWQAGYLLCDVPASLPLSGGPTAPTIAVVSAGGGGSVSLPVRRSMELTGESRGFFVCAKSLYGSVDALRLVEWIEMNLLLGVRHMYIYSLGVNDAAERALERYASLGVVTVVRDNTKQQIERALPKFVALFSGRDATHASGAEPIVQLELLSVHDCLYRFGGAYEYMLVCDTDELLVPRADRTLPELAARLRSASPHVTSFLNHAAAYLRQYETIDSSRAGQRLHTLRYTRRTDIGWDGRKSFHSTRDTTLVDQHERQQPASNNSLMDYNLAWVHHYRDSCKGGSCNSDVRLVDDGAEVVGRYEAELWRNVQRAAAELGLPLRP